MSKAGFVYILVNEFMPDIYKVGCTERSPHTRAEELSNPSGVPAPFQVLCYVEAWDFQELERRMHMWLADCRVTDSREFFLDRLEYAVRLLYWCRDRISFVVPGGPGEPCTFDECMRLPFSSNELHTTLDPWAPTPEADAESVASAAITKAAGNA